MDPILDGCRLCLDPFTECFTTIDNAQLKEQMEKVFCFSIEPKQGYCSGVCQSCSYAISEFYQFSEKVRQNQEVLNGNVTNCDPTVDSKVTLERVKVETIHESGLQEGIEDACEPKVEVSREEEVSNSDDAETTPKKSQTKRKLDDLEAGEPTKNSKHTTLNKQQRNEEDEYFNKHIRMICDLCGTSAATFTKLRSHFRNEHKRACYVVCCNKKLYQQCTIRDHIDFHANPDAFRCEVCGQKFKAKLTLNRHMLKRHSSENPHPFKCDHCPQSFEEKLALTQHTKRHLNDKCPECNKIFASKTSLSFHVANRLCFNRNMNEHEGTKGQRFQCGICQRWLKGERSLRNHMTYVHTDGDQEFQCDICMQKYPHSQALYIHKLRTHAEPKYECEFCGKKFKREISLKEHRTTHTGEILYACEYCGIPNNCMSNMYQHIKRQHPTEWAEKKLMATQSDGPS